MTLGGPRVILDWQYMRMRTFILENVHVGEGIDRIKDLCFVPQGGQKGGIGE